MDSNLITVEVFINGVLFKPMWINTGYECYSSVDKNHLIELRLLSVKILPKSIISFIKENIKEPWVESIEIIKFSMDI